MDAWIVNLDHPTRRSIRCCLGKAAHITGIEPQADDGVSSPLLALLHHSADGVVAARVQHGCEPAKLSASHALHDHAQAGANVTRPHCNAVDCAEDLLDAVTREIHHG